MSRKHRYRLPGMITAGQLTKLQDIPSGELAAMEADIHSLQHVHGATVTKLRIEAEAIRAILASRAKPQFVVSDHAVVRFLEKIEGFDVEAIRQRIAERAAKAAAKTPGVICRAKGDAVAYADEGATFVVARHNTIVTVHTGDRLTPIPDA